MTDFRNAAQEMLDLIDRCPANGVTRLDVAVAFLQRQHSAGKVEGVDDVRKSFDRSAALTQSQE